MGLFNFSKKSSFKTIPHSQLKKELSDFSQIKKKDILEKMKKFETQGMRGISEEELKKGISELRNEYKLNETDKEKLLDIFKEKTKRSSEPSRIELFYQKQKEQDQKNKQSLISGKNKKDEKNQQEEKYPLLSKGFQLKKFQGEKSLGKSLKEIESEISNK